MRCLPQWRRRAGTRDHRENDDHRADWQQDFSSMVTMLHP
jgi:hypothetical protein